MITFSVTPSMEHSSLTTSASLRAASAGHGTRKRSWESSPESLLLIIAFFWDREFFLAIVDLCVERLALRCVVSCRVLSLRRLREEVSSVL